MHFSTIFSVLLATGAIAAPISGLPVDTTEVTNLVSEVEKTAGGVGLPSLPSLPVRGLGLPVDLPVDTKSLPIDTSEVTGVLAEVEGLTGGLGLRRRSSINLTGTLSSVNSILSSVLGLVNTIKGDLDTILSDVESVNVDGIIATVESLLKTVISSLDSLPSSEGIDLGLSALLPTLNQITGELNVVSSTVDSLVSKGVAAEAVAEVKSLLAQALSLANGVSL